MYLKKIIIFIFYYIDKIEEKKIDYSNIIRKCLKLVFLVDILKIILLK